MKTLIFKISKHILSSDIRTQRVCNKLNRFGTIQILQHRNWNMHISKANCLKNVFDLRISLPEHNIVEQLRIQILHESSTRITTTPSPSETTEIFIDYKNIDKIEQLITESIVDILNLPKQVTEITAGHDVKDIDIMWSSIIFDRNSNLYMLPNIREYAPVSAMTSENASSKVKTIEDMIEAVKKRQENEMLAMKRRQDDEIAKLISWKTTISKMV